MKMVIEMKIILLEDDLQLQESLQLALNIKNHDVTCIESVKQTKSLCYKDYDLAILDIQLPDGNGIDVCRHIKKCDDIPVIFLTANDQEESIIAGLNAGGDDYITKPFSLNVLYARINAVTRRINKVMTIGDLKIDMKNYQVFKNDKPINLTAIEYEIIFAFMKNKGQILTRNQLLDRIQEVTGNVVENNTLTVHMKRIRDKLGIFDDHYYIETVRGIGYRFYERK